MLMRLGTTLLDMGGLVNLLSATCAVCVAVACTREPKRMALAEGKSTPVVEREQRPAETEPANVPEFKPAFPEQTRAPLARSQTELHVQEIAVGFDRPWALAFLPDGRMLVTEKPTGRLYVVTAQGKRSAPVEGLPQVDGRNQGGLLDVALAPDFSTIGFGSPRWGREVVTN